MILRVILRVMVPPPRLTMGPPQSGRGPLLLILPIVSVFSVVRCFGFQIFFNQKIYVYGHLLAIGMVNCWRLFYLSFVLFVHFLENEEFICF